MERKSDAVTKSQIKALAQRRFLASFFVTSEKKGL